MFLHNAHIVLISFLNSLLKIVRSCKQKMSIFWKTNKQTNINKPINHNNKTSKQANPKTTPKTERSKFASNFFLSWKYWYGFRCFEVCLVVVVVVAVVVPLCFPADLSSFQFSKPFYFHENVATKVLTFPVQSFSKFFITSSFLPSDFLFLVRRKS